MHRDDEFIRGEVPMTKREIRALSMDFLDVYDGAKCLDIGAGTGSVSVEMASNGGIVTAIESEMEAVKLIYENARKFGLSIDIIHGIAPENIPEDMYDRIFVGGSKRLLREIVDFSYNHLTYDGIIVLNFIVLKNAVYAVELLQSKFFDVETVLIQSSNMDRLGMLRANNPIFIVKGVKR